MKATSKNAPSSKKRYVHRARKRATAHGTCRIITSEDFLHDPKRAVAMAAKGTQVCIKGGKTQIIFGFGTGKTRASQRHKSYGKVLGAKFFAAASKPVESLRVSWIE